MKDGIVTEKRRKESDKDMTFRTKDEPKLRKQKQKDNRICWQWINTRTDRLLNQCKLKRSFQDENGCSNVYIYVCVGKRKKIRTWVGGLIKYDWKDFFDIIFAKHWEKFDIFYVFPICEGGQRKCNLELCLIGHKNEVFWGKTMLPSILHIYYFCWSYEVPTSITLDGGEGGLRP